VRNWGAALEFEAVKFHRSFLVRTISVLLVVGLPSLAAAFLAAAASGTPGLLGSKASAMLPGTGWAGLAGITGQMMSVGVLVGAGLAAAWCFGREFTDKTASSLFALTVGRGWLALAKFTVVTAWALGVILLTMVACLAAGLVAGLGLPDPAAVPIVVKGLTAASLSALLALPLAWVASITRGYLGGIGALLLLIVVTQVVTAFGTGAWFPYAAPGLWVGLAGSEAAAAVTPLQLALALPVSAAGVVATCAWWSTASLDRH